MVAGKFIEQEFKYLRNIQMNPYTIAASGNCCPKT